MNAASPTTARRPTLRPMAHGDDSVRGRRRAARRADLAARPSRRARTGRVAHRRARRRHRRDRRARAERTRRGRRVRGRRSPTPISSSSSSARSRRSTALRSRNGSSSDASPIPLDALETVEQLMHGADAGGPRGPARERCPFRVQRRLGVVLRESELVAAIGGDDPRRRRCSHALASGTDGLARGRGGRVRARRPRGRAARHASARSCSSEATATRSGGASAVSSWRSRASPIASPRWSTERLRSSLAFVALPLPAAQDACRRVGGPRRRARGRAGGSARRRRHRSRRARLPPAPRIRFAVVRAVVEAALAASSSMSANGATQPDVCDPQRDCAQTRVSTSTPPSGSGTSSRAVVVWRPRWSVERTAPVACTSAPTSRFTSVDLPTPDAPISATVTPRRHAAQVFDAGELTELVTTTPRPGARPRRRRPRDRPSRARGPTSSTRSPAPRRSRREHQLALQPPEIRTVLERLRHEHGVDVGRDHLRVARRPSMGSPRTNAEYRGRTATTEALPRVREQHPVAGRNRTRRRDRALRPPSVNTVTSPRSTRATRPDATAGTSSREASASSWGSIPTHQVSRFRGPMFLLACHSMAVAVALFTRTSRSRQSSARRGVRDADRVVPLFVLDDAVSGESTRHAQPPRLLARVSRGSRPRTRSARWPARRQARRLDPRGARRRRGRRRGDGARRPRREWLRGKARFAAPPRCSPSPGRLRPRARVRHRRAALRAAIVERGGPFLVFTPYYERGSRNPGARFAMPRHVHVPHAVERAEIPDLSKLTKAQARRGRRPRRRDGRHHPPARLDAYPSRDLCGRSRRPRRRPDVAHLAVPALWLSLPLEVAPRARTSRR